jgi:hypothetical protein
VELPMVVKMVSNRNVSFENVSLSAGSAEICSSMHEWAVSMKKSPPATMIIIF